MRQVLVIMGMLVAALGVRGEEELPPGREPAKAGWFPIGVADEKWQRVYVAGVDGEVEAIDLASGKTLFASASAAVPLAVAGDRVYVLGHKLDRKKGRLELRVLGMSIKAEGKYVFESTPLPMPKWVEAARATYVVAEARMDKGQLRVEWAAGGYVLKEDPEAYLPLPRTWPPIVLWDSEHIPVADSTEYSRLEETGVVRMDVETGEVKTSSEAVGDSMERRSQIWRSAQRHYWEDQTLWNGDVQFDLGAGGYGVPVLTCREVAGGKVRWQKVVGSTSGALPGLVDVEGRSSNADVERCNSLEVRTLGRQ